jgi:hypothetical protein
VKQISPLEDDDDSVEKFNLVLRKPATLILKFVFTISGINIKNNLVVCCFTPSPPPINNPKAL